MKKKWFSVRILAALCTALGWWGLFYPELVLTPDTVKISTEEEDGTFSPLPMEWTFDSSLYFDLLNADPDKITFRSRLLTELDLFLENLYEKIGK